MNNILPDDFDWIVYKELNPYLYFTGLRTREEYINNYLIEGLYKGRPYKKEQNKRYSFHVLLATIGKKSILKILNMLKKQLTEIDFLTIVFDGFQYTTNSIIVNEFCKNGFKCKVNIIVEKDNLGYWGHGIRNKHNNLEGDFVYHVDDDDTLCEDTFYNIRKYCIDLSKVYIFKITLENGSIVWKKPILQYAKISTQSGVIPSHINSKGFWQLKYGGDFEFYKGLYNKYPFIFIDKMIYIKNKV
jgi:hypothetical protein